MSPKYFGNSTKCNLVYNTNARGQHFTVKSAAGNISFVKHINSNRSVKNIFFAFTEIKFLLFFFLSSIEV